MKTKKINLYTLLGVLCIFLAFVFAAHNVYVDKKAGETADNALEQLKNQIEYITETTEATTEETSDDPLTEKVTEAAMETEIETETETETLPQIKIDGYYYIGILKIPSLGLELPVRGEFSYRALVGAPCRYYGSVYENDLIIAGHNYPRHFGRLKNLKPGAAAYFTDSRGEVSEYTAAEIIKLGERDVSEMKSGDWDLTLFTCTPNGKSRVTVRFIKVL